MKISREFTVLTKCGLYLSCFMATSMSPSHLSAQESVPSWLSPSEQASPTVAPKDRDVYIVTKDKHEIVIRKLQLFVRTDKRNLRNVSKAKFSFRKDGHDFTFSEADIGFVEYYTGARFTLGGKPVELYFKPAIYLADGEKVKDEPRDVSPPQVYKPTKWLYENVVETEFYGKVKSKKTVTQLPDDVLAIAWTKDGAERARESILQRFARNEAVRAHVGWDEDIRIYTQDGPIPISAKVRYTVSMDGGWTNWAENTKGTITLNVDNSDYEFNFSHRCYDTTKPSQFRNRVFCSEIAQVRVSRWEKSPVKKLERLHLGSGGVTVFYGAGAPAKIKNLEGVNVGIDLSIKEK